VADFVKLAATAKRLIDANGRTVTVVQQGNTPADSDKPWRSADATNRASVTGKAVFVSTEPGSLGAQWINRENVKNSDQVAFFAANNDGGKTLEDFDLIVDGSINWKITRAQLLAPADTRLLYVFEVDR
jgi:hypothetical protein